MRATYENVRYALPTYDTIPGSRVCSLFFGHDSAGPWESLHKSWWHGHDQSSQSLNPRPKDRHLWQLAIPEKATYKCNHPGKGTQLWRYRLLLIDPHEGCPRGGPTLSAISLLPWKKNKTMMGFRRRGIKVIVSCIYIRQHTCNTQCLTMLPIWIIELPNPNTREVPPLWSLFHTFLSFVNGSSFVCPTYQSHINLHSFSCP